MNDDPICVIPPEICVMCGLLRSTSPGLRAATLTFPCGFHLLMLRRGNPKGKRTVRTLPFPFGGLSGQVACGFPWQGWYQGSKLRSYEDRARGEESGTGRVDRVRPPWRCKIGQMQ